MKRLPPNTSGIYLIRNVINDRVYVGSSIDINRRWYHHKRFLSQGVHHSPLLQASWNKNGESSFSFELLEEVADHEKLLEREQFWIDSLQAALPKSGFNCSPVAGSTLGKKHTPEAVEKMRLSLLNRGPVSDETRRKLSEAGRGRTPSEETRRKLSESNKGIKKPPTEATLVILARNRLLAMTPSAREKAAAKLRGKKRPPELAAKLGAILRARNASPEFCLKLRKPKSPEHREKLRVMLTARNKAMGEAKRFVPGQGNLPL